MPKQFVLIMTDTQRIDWLSCYGNSRAVTPNLQKWANQGVVFDRAYTCQAVCSPARSAIFTGSYPHTNGMLGNDMYLNENIRTIGQRLQDTGTDVPNMHDDLTGKPFAQQLWAADPNNGTQGGPDVGVRAALRKPVEFKVPRILHSARVEDCAL